MTSEEWNRKMEFILEQRAQFAVRMQELQEAHVQGWRRLSNLDSDLALLDEAVSKISVTRSESDDTLMKAKQLSDEMKARLKALIIAIERQSRGSSEPS